MSGEWTTIGAIAKVFDGPHATPKKIEEGPYFLSISSLENGKLDLSRSARISEEQFKKWTKRVTPREGDVLFSYETRLGEAALMPGEITACLGRRMGLLRPDTTKVDPRFLLFAYLGPAFQQEIRTRTNYGATVERIALKELPDFPIQIPCLSEQKSIAHILGTLDDKIELNHQINASLEAMAQALFKSWFVDFDPVIDNALAAGNPIPEPLQARAESRKALGDKRNRLPESIRHQFPSSFNFSEEMGWMPEGWGIQSIEQISSTIGMGPFGSNIKVDTFVDAGIPIVNGQHLNETLLVEGKHNFITEQHAEQLNKSLAYPGDLVFTHRGTIGQVSLVPKSKQYEKFIVSQSQMFLRPNTGMVTSTFLIYFFRSHIGQHSLLANASQVGVPSIARPSSHLKSIRLLLPSKNCLKEFDTFCGNWLETIQTNRSQAESLGQIRDALLPKLLSGQIRIQNVELQTIEAA